MSTVNLHIHTVSLAPDRQHLVAELNVPEGIEAGNAALAFARDLMGAAHRIIEQRAFAPGIDDPEGVTLEVLPGEWALDSEDEEPTLTAADYNERPRHVALELHVPGAGERIGAMTSAPFMLGHLLYELGGEMIDKMNANAAEAGA